MPTNSTYYQQCAALAVPCEPRVFAYSRFSSDRQTKGDSKRRQEDFFKNWPDAAKYKIERLHDSAISAFKGRNQTFGQFNFFLTELRAKRLGTNPILLIENFDRMSRQELEMAQTLFLEIINLGATIVTLHNGKTYQKGMGLVDIITALVEMDMAHQHSAKLSMRVGKKAAARKASGAITHNRASSPAWLKLDAKRTVFEPIPERVAIVQRMFDMSAKGLGAAAIARVLNTEGVPSWSTRKSGLRAWKQEFISSTLHGRSTLGEFEGRSGYFGGAIIDENLWKRVNDGTRQKAQGRGNGVITEENLLCGLVESAIDKSRMILRKCGAPNRKGKGYIWYSYLVSNATVAGLSNHRVNYKRVEDRLLWLFGNIAPEAMARARVGVRDDTADRLASLAKQVENSKRQVDKYRRLIEIDPEPSASLVLDLKRHEAEHKAATEALTTARQQSEKAQAVPEVGETDLTKPENRRALRAEIAQWCEKITLSKTDLIIWLAEKTGVRVPLQGTPSATFMVTLPEENARKEAVEFESEGVAKAA